MKLLDIKEEVVYEEDGFQIIAILTEKKAALSIRASAGKLIGKGGKISKAGALGSYALDHIKRYAKLKAASNRSIAFYARNTQERRAYEKVVKNLTKNKEYKIVRTFPYAGGARSWELKKVKK